MPTRRKKPPIEYSGKLVYPFPVSMDHNDPKPDRRGTYAFLHPDNESIQNAKGWRKEYLEGKREVKALRQIDAAEMIFRNLRHAAHQSDYFMKPTNARVKAIRAKLKSLGIPVEEPIQKLGAGKELFARGKNRPLIKWTRVDESIRDCRPIIAQMMRIMLRMHRAGIVHGHPHINNFVISPGGKVILIDLNLARQDKSMPHSKREFIDRFKVDFTRFCFAVSQLMHDVPGTKWYNVEANALYTAQIAANRLLKAYAKAGIKTFGVKAEEMMGLEG